MWHSINLPSFTSRFHMISNSDILGPDVKLPFSGSNETRENVTRVNSNSHIDVNMVLVSAKKGGEIRS